MTRQRENFLILMNNMNMALGFQKDQLNATGSAMVRYAEFSKSTQAKVNDFTNAMQQMWLKFVNSDTINGLLDGLTKVVQKFGNLQTIVIQLGLILMAWKGVAILNFFKSLPLAVNNSIQSFISARFALARLSEEQALNMMRTTGLTLAWNGLKVAFMSNPFGFITTAITIAFTALTLFGGEVDNTKQKIEDSVTVFNQQKLEIENLAQTYKENAELSKTDSNAKVKLIDIETQLSQKFGDSAKNIDLQNGKIDENIEKIKKLGIIKAQEIIRQNQIFADEAKKQLNSTAGYGFDDKGNETALNSYQYKDNLATQIDNLNKIKNKSQGDTDYLKSLITRYDELTEKIKKLEEPIKAVDVANKAIAESSEEAAKALQDVSDKSKGVKQVNLAEEFKKVSDSEETLRKNTSSLSSAYKELSDNGEINIQTAMDLLKQYPNLINSMKLENGQVKLNKSALESLWNVEKQRHISALQGMQDRLKAQNEATKNTIENYKKEAEALGKLINLQSNNIMSKMGGSINKIGAGIADTVQKTNDAATAKEFDNLTKQIELYKGIDLKSFSGYEPKKEKSSSSGADATISDTVLEIDRYMDLESAIESVNEALDKNKTAQEDATTPLQKIALMEKENKLLDDKVIKLRNLYKEQKKEKLELKDKLSKAGFEFSEDGSLVNATDKLKAEKIAINKKNKEDKEKANKLFKQTQDDIKRYNDISKKINETSKDSQSAQRTKLKNKNIEAPKIKQDEIKSILDSAQEQVDSLFSKNDLLIKVSQSRQETMVKYSKEYNAETAKQLELKNQEQQKLKITNDYYKNILATNKDLNKEKRDWLNQQITANSAKWWDVEIEGIQKAKELIKEQIDLEKRRKEDIVNTMQEDFNNVEKAKSIELEGKEKKLKKDIAELDKTIFYVSRQQFSEFQTSKISQLQMELSTLKTREQTADVLDEISAKERLLTLEQNSQYDTITDFKALYQEINKSEEDKLKAKIDEIEQQGQYYIKEEKDLIIQKIKLDLQANKMTMFDDELNRLSAIDKLKDKDLERLQKQIELEKQRQTVANIEKERDSKMLIDGKWQFVANPTKLREEKEKLLALEIDYAKYERDEKYNADKEAIQAEIDKKNDVFSIREDTFRRESDILDKTLQKEKDSWEETKKVRQLAIDDLKSSVDKQYKDMEKLADTRLKEVQGIVGTNWDNIMAYLAGGMNNLKTNSETALNDFRNNITAMSNDIQAQVQLAINAVNSIDNLFKNSTTSSKKSSGTTGTITWNPDSKTIPISSLPPIVTDIVGNPIGTGMNIASSTVSSGISSANSAIQSLGKVLGGMIGTSISVANMTVQTNDAKQLVSGLKSYSRSGA